MQNNCLFSLIAHLNDVKFCRQLHQGFCFIIVTIIIIIIMLSLVVLQTRLLASPFATFSWLLSRWCLRLLAHNLVIHAALSPHHHAAA